MSQNRSDRFQSATCVVALVSTLALAGCNPAPQPESAPVASAPTAAAIVSSAPAPTDPAATPETPQAVAAAAAPMATATAMPVARSVTQTAVTTPARPAAPGAASSSTRPAVVTGALPPGAGREVVQRVCGSCHGIDTVTAVGRTPAQWSDIIGQMQNMGLSASDDDLATVHAYLSRQLPPK